MSLVITNQNLTVQQTEYLRDLSKRLTASVKDGKMSKEQEAEIMMTLNGNPKFIELARQNKYKHSRALMTIGRDWESWILSPKSTSQDLSKVVDSPKVVSLVELKLYESEEYRFLIVAKLIIWVLSKLNVQRTVRDNQVLGIYQMIVDNYFYLKLSELKYCFQKGLSGTYGKLYGKIDETDFANWLNEYVKERDDYVSRKKENDSNIQKKTEKELKPNKQNKRFIDAMLLLGSKIDASREQNLLEARKNRFKSMIVSKEISILNYQVILSDNSMRTHWKDAKINIDNIQKSIENLNFQIIEIDKKINQRQDGTA